ncbi:sensor histidine kinase [Microbacterium sp. M]|uniref:sensor histidine kinase n=1 Tax=Microbacterium sp. M TaxID=3377125 RepID=UPI003867D023
MSRIGREQLGWDIAVGALMIVMSVLALTEEPRTPGTQWILVVVALAIGAVYAFGARRYVSIRESPIPSPAASYALQFSLMALLAIGVAIQPSMLLLQTIVLPLLWMTARSPRQAIVATVINAVILGLSYWSWGGFETWALLAGFLTSGLSAAFSIALGLWITRIAEWGAERQRLLSDLTAAQADLDAASREAGATAERERLARDVHDTIAQSLTSIVMLAERAGRDGSATTIALIEDAARDALREARALVVVESPATDPSGSLAQALQRLGERFAHETGTAVHVEASEWTVPRDVQVVLLRCAQEGLANVRKHAAADTARLTLQVGSDAVLRVSDDGQGGAEIDAGNGFGLAGMRDRVALVGGILDVRDAEPTGTVLTVRIPLNEEKDLS